QGHNYVNIAHEQVQPMLLRAIAWAGKAPIDSLLTVRPRGGRGNRDGRGSNPIGGAPLPAEPAAGATSPTSRTPAK
ncbi:MAG: hypothetical protein ABIR80_03875, partial [Opitutaceae bacterium]